MTQEELFKKLVAHSKEYGFIFPSSEIYDGLSAVYDYGQLGVELKNNIKRYCRQDAIGTPFCITYDFDSENDGCVTVRDRDSMEQERVKIDELEAYIAEKIDF